MIILLYYLFFTVLVILINDFTIVKYFCEDYCLVYHTKTKINDDKKTVTGKIH